MLDPAHDPRQLGGRGDLEGRGDRRRVVGCYVHRRRDDVDLVLGDDLVDGRDQSDQPLRRRSDESDRRLRGRARFEPGLSRVDVDRMGIELVGNQVDVGVCLRQTLCAGS